MNKTYILDGRIKFLITEKKLINIDSGTCIKLRAPAALCLRLLIDQKGKLVTHKELCHYGWEQFGMMVSLNVLHNTMFYLRKSLITIGEFDATIIESIHRRGFVFHDKINIEVINGRIPHEKMYDVEKNDEKSKEENNLQIRNNDGIPSRIIDKEETKGKLIEKEIKIEKVIINNKSGNQYNNSPYMAAGSGDTRISDGWLKNKHIQTWALIILITIIITCILTGCLFYLNNSSRSISGYTYEGRYGKCLIYLKGDIKNINGLKAINKFKQICNKAGYLYITNNLYSNNASLIWCDKRADVMNEISCNSYYFSYKEEESKYE